MNSQDNKTYEHYLHNVVTNLPKGKAQKKFQKFYDILLAVLILAPILVAPTLMALGYVMPGVLIIVICFSLVAIIGINRRKLITRRFYKVRKAYKRVYVRRVTSFQLLYDLYDDSALTIFAEPTNEILNFLYNWLNNEGVLARGILEVYTFDGKMLNEAFEHESFYENEQFISVFMKDLAIYDYNIESFSEARLNIGARWLDDIIEGM